LCIILLFADDNPCIFQYLLELLSSHARIADELSEDEPVPALVMLGVSLQGFLIELNSLLIASFVEFYFSIRKCNLSRYLCDFRVLDELHLFLRHFVLSQPVVGFQLQLV
jgi:hypothetical protein